MEAESYAYSGRVAPNNICQPDFNKHKIPRLEIVAKVVNVHITFIA
jgi:hypothetical protein